MKFKKMVARALEIREKYTKFEAEAFGRSWTSEEIALGFVGDVGDLMKLVMAENGIRSIPNHREKLGHEMSDCLWAIIVLADKFNIDLETEFMRTMAEIESALKTN